MVHRGGVYSFLFQQGGDYVYFSTEVSTVTKIPRGEIKPQVIQPSCIITCFSLEGQILRHKCINNQFNLAGRYCKTYLYAKLRMVPRKAEKVS